MISEKPKKTPKIFVCVLCDFSCSNKKDYSRHLLTRKHKMISMNTKPKPERNHDCKCGKKYTTASNLLRHMKICYFCQCGNSETPSSDTHENNVDKSMIQNDTKMIQNEKHFFSCGCGKTYAHRNNLYRHKLMCDYLDSVTLNHAQSMDLASLHEDIAIIMKQQATFMDMIPNIGSHTTINNNRFNLIVYLNETCKDAIKFG